MEGELLEKEEGSRKQIQLGLPSEAIDKVAIKKEAEVTHFVKPYITPFSHIYITATFETGTIQTSGRP